MIVHGKRGKDISIHMKMLHCIRLCFIITHAGDVRCNLAHLKGRNRWILKKILEDKDYIHILYPTEGILQRHLQCNISDNRQVLDNNYLLGSYSPEQCLIR